eukprot:Nk52_evm26s223 gene=Nk52_evmTU26s223
MAVTDSFATDDSNNEPELPLQIPPGLLEAHPNFAKLLSRLTPHLCTPLGCSMTMHQSLEEAKNECQESKINFFHKSLVLGRLLEYVYETDKARGEAGEDKRLHGEDLSQGNDVRDAVRVVLEAELASQVLDVSYFNIHGEASGDGASPATLFGLSPADVEQHGSEFAYPSAEDCVQMQQDLIPEIENRLKSMCEKIYNFYNPISGTSVALDRKSSKYSFAKASQLPALLEKDKATIEEESKEAKRLQGTREDYQKDIVHKIIEYVNLLQKVIVEYKLGSTYEASSVHSKWMVCKSEALILKLNLVKDQLLCDTYPEGAIKALGKIQAHLESSRDQLRNELLRYEAALKAYRCVGPGFEQLGKEYAAILEEIENKKWALSELGKDIDTEPFL